MCQRKQEWIKDCEGNYIDLSIALQIRIDDQTIEIVNKDYDDYSYDRDDYKDNYSTNNRFDDFKNRLKQKLEKEE